MVNLHYNRIPTVLFAMALIILASIAFLLAVYCKCNLRKIQSILLEQFASKTGSRTFFSTFSPHKKIVADSSLIWQRGRDVWDIPGPPTIPLLGTRWIFFGFLKIYKMSKLHEAYADMNKKYGPIVREVTSSGLPIVHLFDRQDIEKVLKYPSKYPFRPPTEIIVTYRLSRPDRYASVGLTNAQGAIWHKLRTSLTASITSPRVIQTFLPALNSICDDFIDLLRDRRDPKTLIVTHFEDIANLMGLEAVCTLTLGRRMGFLSRNGEQPEKIKQLAAAVKQLFISQRDSYYGLGLWKYIPTRTYTDFAKSEETIYNVISEIVEKSLAEDEELSSRFNATTAAGNNNDCLQSIFRNILDIKDLDIRDKKSAIIDYIAAGIETLANTLIFVLSAVTNHNHAVSYILEEFIANKSSDISQDTITNASYTKACLQEVYRICPTAFCLARILEENTQLSGYELKAGTVILCQNMIACHKECNFREANRFNPERWLDTNGKFNVNTSCSSIIVPYGIGKRTCPGKRFVEMEIILLLSKLILAFDIDFVKPMEAEFEFLLAPKTPVNLILKDRLL